MPMPATAAVVLISSRGLRLAEVPAFRPQTFRLYEPTIRTEDVAEIKKGRMTAYTKLDGGSYLEQEGASPAEA